MKKTITFLVIITLSLHIKSQIVFDLSDKTVTTETIDITEDIVIFKNLIPCKVDNKKYSFTIEMKEEVITTIPKLDPSSGVCYNDSSILGKALFNLINAPDESKVDLLKTILEKTPIEKKDTVCSDYVQEIIGKTTYPKPLQFNLRYNQTITITVKRKENDYTITWVKIFKTPEKTPWHILYGFTFIPNMMNPIQNYYSQADTSGKLYTITKNNNQRNDFLKNISPTIMIQWTPLNKYIFRKDFGRALVSNNFYQLGFVGGLSLNFASETGNANVMAGPTLVIADNISLSAGVVLTQKDVLKGKYKENQIVKENLDFEQLHEKKYMGEWFISLSIRFESNPFKKDEKK